jgi:hypothetical protein
VTRPSYGLNLTTLRVYMTQDDWVTQEWLNI